MGANTKIAWTDHSFNPWRGCTKVSPGCASCYAETLSHRNPAVLGEWGPGKPRVKASPRKANEVRRWNREAPGFGICDRCGPKIDITREGRCPCCSRVDLWVPRRPRVFCNSLSDVFDKEVPDEWRLELFDLIHECKNLDFIVLTKRIQEGKEFLHGSSGAMAGMVRELTKHGHPEHPLYLPKTLRPVEWKEAA